MIFVVLHLFIIVEQASYERKCSVCAILTANE